MTPLRLICFDLGRVLVRISDTWTEAFTAAGVPAPPDPLPPHLEEIAHLLTCDHETGKITNQQFCERFAPHLHLNADQISRMMSSFLVGTYSGGPQLLRDIRQAGFLTACLSNTNDTHWKCMSDPTHRAYVPWDQFDYTFFSQQIGHRKPAEEIYRHVEEVTGLKGQQIIFFDDLEANIDTPRRMGWMTELILRDHKPIEQMRAHLKRLGVLK